MASQMQGESLPTFSFVIPARNESRDIAATIDNLLNIDYPNKEIIVVDDSSDDTPDIVRGYSDKGVRLLHRDHNRNGCCGARNLGMQNATGDYIVIINADVRPRRDFLWRLLEHYQQGADWIVGNSNAINLDNLWARYMHAQELSKRGKVDYLWSEGFSVKREAAAAVGYIPGDFPVNFCRDVKLGIGLTEAGYKKHLAADLFIDHIAHDTFAEFWRMRVTMNMWSPLNFYYFQTYSPPMIITRLLLKTLRTLVFDLTLLVPLLKSWRLSAYIGRSHVFELLFARYVEDLGSVRGNLKGLRRLLQIIRNPPS